MVVGPSATGLLLEIGIVLEDDDPRVIHAMAARPRFLRFLKGTLS